MNILFDGNFLFHKTFSVWSMYYQDRKKSPEENEKAILDALNDKEKQQVLIRKIIMDMCATIRRFDNVDKVAVVIDSLSWRYRFYEDYKYALTRVRPAYYSGFLHMLNEFEHLLRKKGVIVSRVNGAEGDDLLYIWSIYFTRVLEEDLVIITGDSDIRQIMNQHISIFCNNSKNLKFYCIPQKEVEWNEFFDTDVLVEPTKPFEILLYKVIMGDTSDNIPKLKKGFGNVAFKKFIDFITPYDIPKDGTELLDVAQWIADRFSQFSKTKYEDVLGLILFNIKMTWLNLSVYNDMDYISENGKSLLENMLNDINEQKDTYSYNKKYSLEEFYGLTIK
jgi:hypothetical protein